MSFAAQNTRRFHCYQKLQFRNLFGIRSKQKHRTDGAAFLLDMFALRPNVHIFCYMEV